MTEEQRRQAAAQRCADLANESVNKTCWEAEDFLDDTFGTGSALLNAILQLDELARMAAEDAQKYGLENLGKMARQHILPAPNPSPVERLSDELDVKTGALEYYLEELGLKLVEVDPSDDQ